MSPHMPYAARPETGAATWLVMVAQLGEPWREGCGTFEHRGQRASRAGGQAAPKLDGSGRLWRYGGMPANDQWDPALQEKGRDLIDIKRRLQWSGSAV